MTTARRSKPKITPWRRRARTIADPQAIPGDLDNLFLYREVVRTDLGRRLVEAFIGIRSKSIRSKIVELMEIVADEGQGRP